MPRYARVTLGTIHQVTTALTLPGPEWQRCPDDCTTAWTVTPNGQWIAPQRILTAGEFYALFTAAERIAMRAADPRLDDAEQKAQAQGRLNIASPECAQLMALAVAKGALTQARANAVLAGEPPG